MSKKRGSTSAAAGLGSLLRQLRLERSLALREVAAAAGMDQAHLSKAELGQRLPTAGQTAALARFFRHDPIELEAHRIAEKFRRRHADSPAAARALSLLQGSEGKTRTPVSRPRPKRARPVAAIPPAPAPSTLEYPTPEHAVLVLHAD